jgi:hypothetical protein
MLAADGTPAHWLGEVYQGKRLREPINVVIVMRGAASAEDAKKRLIATAGEAGYAVRMGHSSGYQGYVGDQLYGRSRPDGTTPSPMSLRVQQQPWAHLRAAQGSQ